MVYLKSPDLLSKYAHCNGNHPANYKGCTIYKELHCHPRHNNQQKQPIQSFTQQASPNNMSTSHPKNPAPGTEPKYSYAEATATTSNAPLSNFSNTQPPTKKGSLNLFIKLLFVNGSY